MPSDAEIDALIERLSQFEGRDWETTACYNGLRLEAAAFLAALRDERKKWQSFPQQMAAETLLEALTRADKAEARVRELEQKLKEYEDQDTFIDTVTKFYLKHNEVDGEDV